jgi:hypothetical protein
MGWCILQVRKYGTSFKIQVQNISLNRVCRKNNPFHEELNMHWEAYMDLQSFIQNSYKNTWTFDRMGLNNNQYTKLNLSGNNSNNILAV